MNPTSTDDTTEGTSRVPEVAVLPWGTDAWALTVPPGSDVRALFEAAARIPAGLRFVEAFGDVDVVLVYQAEHAEVSRRGAVGAVLRATLDLDPASAPVSGRRWMTAGEREAYLAGKADLASAMLREVTRLIAPSPPDPAPAATPPD